MLNFTNVGITLFFVLLLVLDVIFIRLAMKSQKVVDQIMTINPDGRPYVSKFREFSNQ